MVPRMMAHQTRRTSHTHVSRDVLVTIPYLPAQTCERLVYTQGFSTFPRLSPKKNTRWLLHGNSNARLVGETKEDAGQRTVAKFNIEKLTYVLESMV